MVSKTLRDKLRDSLKTSKDEFREKLKETLRAYRAEFRHAVYVHVRDNAKQSYGEIADLIGISRSEVILILKEYGYSRPRGGRRNANA